MQEVISRTSATERGLLRYFTGKPCKRGHVAERNVIGKYCLDCSTIAHAKHRAQFTEEEWNAKERVRCMDYINRNREKKRATARKSMAKAYAADPQRFIKRSNDFEQRLIAEDPKRARLSQAARRAAYNVRMCGTVSERGLTAIVRRVWDKSEGKCAVCKSASDLELDHILAVANGGTNDESNLQFLCMTCNRSKSAKDFNAWLASRAPVEGMAA